MKPIPFIALLVACGAVLVVCENGAPVVQSELLNAVKQSIESAENKPKVENHAERDQQDPLVNGGKIEKSEKAEKGETEKDLQQQKEPVVAEQTELVEESNIQTTIGGAGEQREENPEQNSGKELEKYLGKISEKNPGDKKSQEKYRAPVGKNGKSKTEPSAEVLAGGDKADENEEEAMTTQEPATGQSNEGEIADSGKKESDSEQIEHLLVVKGGDGAKSPTHAEQGSENPENVGNSENSENTENAVSKAAAVVKRGENGEEVAVLNDSIALPHIREADVKITDDPQTMVLAGIVAFVGIVLLLMMVCRKPSDENTDSRGVSNRVNGARQLSKVDELERIETIPSEDILDGEFGNDELSADLSELLQKILSESSLPRFAMGEYSRIFAENYLTTVDQLKSMDTDDWNRLEMPERIVTLIRTEISPKFKKQQKLLAEKDINVLLDSEAEEKISEEV